MNLSVRIRVATDTRLRVGEDLKHEKSSAERPG
jgi:hypothetical protein